MDFWLWKVENLDTLMVLNPAARLRSTVIGLFWEMVQINVGSLRVRPHLEVFYPCFYTGGSSLCKWRRSFIM